MAALAAALAAASAPGDAAGAGCAPNLASSLASTGSATQLVTVVAATRKSTSGSLRRWQRLDGCWVPAGAARRATLGRAGVSNHHVEGDGTTPAGAFQLGPSLYGVAPDPGVAYPYVRLGCGDWWDEDAASPTYNTLQRLPCAAHPSFGGASEPMWRSPGAYAHFAFVEYNTNPTVPGRGSAIFIHNDLGHPTNGCITLPPGELLQLLLWLRPADSPLVVIGTAAEIRRF